MFSTAMKEALAERNMAFYYYSKSSELEDEMRNQAIRSDIQIENLQTKTKLVLFIPSD